MAGYIDIHSHLLPGVDDGCRSVEESLASIRILKAHGFIGSVCTPHACWRELPGNTWYDIRKRTASLQVKVYNAGLDYRLWPGAEVLLHRRTTQWLLNHGIPTLGNGNCVLMDFWGKQWPDYCDDVFGFLFERGYQPILAHPERQYVPNDVFDAVFPTWGESGVWLQGNFRSITGTEQEERNRERARMLEMGASLTPGIAPICPARERMEHLLAQNAYHVMASDAHLLEELHTRLAGFGVLKERVGEPTMDLWLNRRPREILGLLEEEGI